MWVLWTGISFLGAVAAHAVAVRLPIPGSVVVRFLLPGSVIGLALVFLLVAAFGLSLATLAGTLLFAFLCELYIFLFTLAVSSVSASILRTLRSGLATSGRLNELYNPGAMVGRRVDRLYRSGFLARSSMGFALTRRGRTMQGAFSVLKRFFGFC